MKLLPSLVFVFLLNAAVFAQNADPLDGHLLDGRWTITATDGFGINRGDSITLTYGFVADGTPVAANGLPDENSSLVAFLDAGFGETTTSADLTQRSWFPIFEETFDRYAAISGLNFAYEPNDDGARVDGVVSNFNDLGSLNTVADVRIGGRSIDGQSGTNALAFNYFPIAGDMVLDTDNIVLFGSDTLAFRNVIAHEFGHGLGIEHPLSNSEDFLLEPFLNTAFNGPQHSDILALHRGYGDFLEGGSGNDNVNNATFLGNIDVFSGIGLDGDNTDVAITDEDFISIDGTSDVDVFSFSVTQTGILSIDLIPLGYEYDIAEQAADGTADESTRVDVNTAALNDLEFVLLDQDGTTVLGSGNSSGIGLVESLNNVSLAAGTYFIEVSGDDDRAQFYSLTSDFVVTAIPEPSSLLVTLLIGAACGLRRRKRSSH